VTSDGGGDGEGAPSLEARALSVRLGGRHIVRGVELRVHAGEVLGVFGPSGAGKTTLFRALAGELAPSSGGVFLSGVDVTALPLWRRARLGLGWVPQTPSVLFDLTVADNLAVFSALSAGARQPTRPALAIAEALGLGGRVEVSAGALSGGERRRLELARALCAGPRVLLCDEPFAAIDPAGASAVAAEIRGAAEAGAAVVIADHHVAEALRLCGRAALLLEGELAVLGGTEEFAAHELVRKHYVVL
jgi:lipopolysaccharide export system ATP-binding protein